MPATALGRCSALSLLLLWACAAGAQTPAAKGVPVEERGGPSGTMLQQQQRTSAAYRALAQARYERQQAEQDYGNTGDAYRAAQQRADTLKADLAKLAKARDAAKEKESAAAKAYDNELKGGPR